MSSSPRKFISRRQELPLKGEQTTLFLQIMISIAVFIFAITLSGVLAINAMLHNWNQSILGSLTVQIMPVNDTNREKAMAETLAYQDKAVDFLKTVDGVLKVTPLPEVQLQKLIRPWLGDGVNLENLPMPRIIDVKISTDAEIDFAKLAQDLAQASPLASLDNHKLWLSKLIQFADGLKALAMSILVLVIGITYGAIFYTTQMGAKDTYVAQQYAKRMAFLGLAGGIVGLFFAIPTIFFIGYLAKQIEGGIISEANLSFNDWLMIMSLPLFSMCIAMSTAYYTVKRTLQKLI